MTTGVRSLKAREGHLTLFTTSTFDISQGRSKIITHKFSFHRNHLLRISSRSEKPGRISQEFDVPFENSGNLDLSKSFNGEFRGSYQF